MPADLATWLLRAQEPPSIFRRAFDVAKKIFQPLAGLAIILVTFYLLFRVFRYLFSFLVVDFPARGGGVQFATFALVIVSFAFQINLLLKVRRRSKPDQVGKSDETATNSAPIQTPAGVESGEYPTWRIWRDLVLIWGLTAIIVWLHLASLVETFGWYIIGVVVLLSIGTGPFLVFRGRFSRLGKWFEERTLEAASSLLTQLVRLEVTIRTSNQPTSTDRPLTDVPELDVSLKTILPAFQFLLPLFPGLRTQLMFGGISGKSGVKPYEKLNEELSTTKFAERFSSLRRRLRKFSLAVEINLPDGPVNGLCWESLLSGIGTDKELRHEYLPFNIYRRLSLTIGRASSQAGEKTVLALAEGDLERSLAKDGWKALEKSSLALNFELKGRNEIIAKDSRPEVSVIHMIGTIENSSLGVGLRLGEEQLTLTIQSSESSGDSDPLVRVEDITRTFPNLSVCIIQEEPRQVNPQRLEGDRRDAFFARLFASQMFAAGVPFVLVIPPLRITEATTVIERLARDLTKDPWFKRADLLKTSGDLRLQIGRYASSFGADPVTAQELPQDLCIYLNREWDGRLT